MYLEISTVFILISIFISMFSLVILKFYECFNLTKDKQNLTKISNNQLAIIDVQARVIDAHNNELTEQRQLFQKLLDMLENRLN
jgi:hypothetical protein